MKTLKNHKNFYINIQNIKSRSPIKRNTLKIIFLVSMVGRNFQILNPFFKWH